MNSSANVPLPDATPFCAIGVDVGGTKTAAGVVAFPAGQLLARRQIRTDAARGGAAVLEAVLRLVDELAAEAGALGLRVQAVGVGVCELVDAAGEVRSGQCVAWRGLPVRARLATRAPAIVEADVRAAALAEALFGHGQGRRCFLYVTVGTGISSCLVLDSQPFSGARGATGTMASGLSRRVCERCGFPDERTLEELAAGPALVAAYNRQHRAPVGSAEELLAAAAGGAGPAAAVVRGGGAALGAAIAHLVNVLDPEVVVVGGGLVLSGGLYWESLAAALRAHVWSDLHHELPVLPARTGLDAGLLGAAAAAWRRTATVAG